MNSLEIREFAQSIVNLINSCSLPMEVKRLIVNDIARQVNEATTNQMNAELAERNKAKESEVSDNGDEQGLHKN